MTLENYKTLKLDASWRPVEVISATDALILAMEGKAQVLEVWDRKISSVDSTFNLPAVIVLGTYIRKKRFKVRCTRKNVMLRDKHLCQYCGMGGMRLTLDHVFPRSRGGIKTWTNIVAACIHCNQRKADKTPEEARMKLLREPRKPTFKAWTDHINVPRKEMWKKYI